MLMEATGSLLGLVVVLQAGNSGVQVSMSVNFFNLPNSPSCIMELRLVLPLKKIRTRKNSFKGRARPARKSNLLLSVDVLDNVGSSTFTAL
jgi:hypothetical protein